jgi:diadenosine tetraphosphate (Ap4A) HIT family hydrolase
VAEVAKIKGNVMESFNLHSQLEKGCIELADFPLCKLLLNNDSNYPWFILVPRVTDVAEIFQLSWQDQQQFLNESSLLGEILMQVFAGDKLNVAALGNMVPQLHIHHIVRFKNDICWPEPVWGKQTALPYTDNELSMIKEQLLPKITKVLA